MEGRIRLYSSDDSIYAPGAFDKVLGKRVPIRNNDVVVGAGTIIGAKVSEDGLFVELTLDTDLILEDVIERSLSCGTDGPPDEGNPPTG